MRATPRTFMVAVTLDTDGQHEALIVQDSGERSRIKLDDTYTFHLSLEGGPACRLDLALSEES